MTTATRSRWMLTINAFLLGSLLTLALAGGEAGYFISGWMREPQAKADLPEPELYSRGDFSGRAMGKTQAEMVEWLGNPSRVSEDSDATYWHYRRITRNPVTGDVDDDVQVVFRNGKVDALGF